MQNQNIAVLIFAQSGRFLAQSATHAGYRVWVADCFGDQDTLSCSERWQAVPPMSTLSAQQALSLITRLSNGEECLLICGSGIEKYYPFLSLLPDHIHYIGNSEHTIQTLKSPRLFFSLLDKLKLPYPQTFFSAPTSNSKHYIAKSASGMGGIHIEKLDNKKFNDDYYYQQFIEGQSGSVLFISNGSQSQLISINKQSLSSHPLRAFCLASIESPWALEPHHRSYLLTAINELTVATQIMGLNSLDFIVSKDNNIFILEINPRPSASAELYPDPSSLLQSHIDACQGKEISLPSIPTSLSALHHTLFADTNLMIPPDMNWPEMCHDLPRAGTKINQNEPICTIVIKSHTKRDVDMTMKIIEENIKDQLISLK
jgi:predicted ATP-grasp superfamily ATP-dependent carboligase